MSATAPTFQELGPCACDRPACDVVGTKLVKPLEPGDPQHLKGCKCPPHTGKRNQAKGKRGQAKTHRNLGGLGFTPSNEESGRPYVVEVSILPEVKSGSQVPKSFDTFIKSEWFRHALSQAERSAPYGAGVMPAVVIRGDWCIVDIRKKREQVA